MPSPSRRRVALYCTVISTGPLVVVRMPEKFVPWTTIRKEIMASIRRTHGIRAKGVHAIEALAGEIGGDRDGGKAREAYDRAFNGDATVLQAFALHAWRDDLAGFEMIRKATSSPIQGETA